MGYYWLILVQIKLKEKEHSLQKCKTKILLQEIAWFLHGYIIVSFGSECEPSNRNGEQLNNKNNSLNKIQS